MLASLFGFFTFAMTLTAARFILTNITNIDMLRKTQSFSLAVRIPRNTPPSDAFPTIVYPLQRPPVRQMTDAANLRANGYLANGSDRDLRASRKFAILRTEPSENPWDLGFWANWKSVMGSHPIHWLLPIWSSPCCNHEGMKSDYQIGPLLETLKKRYGVPELNGDVGAMVEMHDTRAPGA